MAPPQFTLYSHASGPNGWKVNFLLRALDLSFETKYLEFSTSEQKSAEHVAFNPNGRIPTLVDHHNDDFAVWESDAILLYLASTYDKTGAFSGKNPKEVTSVIQWLFFQSSGQGAYFGQAAHFKLFAPERIPYATERYQKEVARVFSVLEAVLSKQAWIAAPHCTIADLSFVPWNTIAMAALLPESIDAKTEYPAVVAWHEKLMALPYVVAAYKEKADVAAAAAK